MIDIILYADAVLKVHIVVDGSKDIFLRDALRNELVDVAAEFCFQLFLVIPCFFQNLF